MNCLTILLLFVVIETHAAVYIGLEGGYESIDFYKTLVIRTKSDNTLDYDKQDHLNGRGLNIMAISMIKMHIC